MSKRTVVLHIEGVPNPNAMKIVLENGILTDTPYEFTNLGDAANSPLAQKLLMYRYIDRIMLNANYVTIVKNATQSPAWDTILLELRSLVQNHLENNEAILFMGSEKLVHTRSDDVIIPMITDILNKYVRPAAQEDGGDILFDSYEKGVLTLRMHGACHKCPYIKQTLKDGVEKVMQELVPEVREVKPRLVS